ncbi:cell wall-binding repeat-containing protein [Microbacterium invictum]|uniref:Cell wall-binding protein n=1 Tax=Microbacterium invictum TaxID=515415 RepID=A0AA40SN43_9MICO|nr:cell wall-binding repeat-containing protein [Microbacterium invictum]MBB4139209.1 putative cell wall-binding protein [Microbacterium invictum]
MTGRFRRALSALAIIALVAGGAVALDIAPASAAAGQVTRIAGADRYETSAAISAATFAAGAPVAYIASGALFPDALSGSAAAAAGGGPVLLTTPTALPKAIGDELRRLKPKRIVVLGGEGAISATVAEDLAGYTGGSVERRSGADRYETSAATSAATFAAGVPVVFLASGVEFPDALSGAALAARLGGPVLLTTPGAVPGSIEAELKRLKPTRLVVLGGTGAVSKAVADAASRATGRSAERIGGADRYATSAAIAQEFPTGAPVAYLASGTVFADALSGAAAAAGAPLLLTQPTVLSPATGVALTRLAPAKAVVLGGTGAVAQAVSTLVQDFGVAHARASGDRVTATTELKAGSCLASNNGTVGLCVTANGTITVDRNGSVLWSSGTTASDAATLRIRADGNLALFGTGGQIRWQASTTGTAATRLVVANDGEVSLQTGSGAIRWATMTGPDAPTWGLPFAAGERWSAGAPHTSLGTNQGARGSLDFGPSRTIPASSKKVYTIAEGTVYRFNCGGGKGYLGVNHTGGWQSTYYHLKNEQTARIGKKVPAGTYLGDVAQALPCGGGSSFEHVHVTIRRDGQPVSVEGMTFGGFTVRSAGKDFSGTWRDASGRTVLTPSGGAACCLTAPGAK